MFRKGLKGRLRVGLWNETNKYDWLEGTIGKEAEGILKNLELQFNQNSKKDNVVDEEMIKLDIDENHKPDIGVLNAENLA
jgi:hypothetical protein